MTERDKDIARRFLFAESQSRRDQYRPKEEKKDWLTTHCTHCDYRIQYIPKEGYQGQLKCPDCGKIFDVPDDDQKSKGVTLDDFSKEKRRKWKITHCPNCQKRVEYHPKKDDWDRKLLCPHCHRVFELPSLDRFTGDVVK